jgi:CRISPR/Cas system-associated exonuclease Cas4 (RecB family)
MSKLSYNLTKSKIITGLRCPKKLWFDINEKIEIDHFLFHKGNVFGEKIKEIYGDGLDLSNNFEDDVIQLTNDAMNDPKVNIIYEGAFLFEETLVRTDVLIRKNNGWKLIEAKSSQSLQEHHLQDIAIQYYVLNNLNVLITEATIAHINKDFIYEGKNDYKDLIVEVEVLGDIQQFVTSVPDWIKDLLPVTEKVTEPIFDMGDHCKGCQYIEKCKSNSFLGKIEIPISILPNYGNKLQKQWFDNKIYDLRDLPYESVESIKDKRWNLVEIIKSHKENIEWINPNFSGIIKKYSWPRYFFDIESVMQAVPIIPSTKPNDQFPFQYSVHKWEFEDQELTLEDSNQFLEFNSENMDRKYLEKLINDLGTEGPIFAHNAPTEINALSYLVERKNCIDLTDKIENIQSRIYDTAKLFRENFYNVAMMGSYSLKDIIKILPNASSYSSENDQVGDGGDAMIKWFQYTNTNTTNKEKQKIRENLTDYCAKDTLNLYLIFKYIYSKKS